MFSFNTRRKRNEVAAMLRRLVDLSCPGVCGDGQERRSDSRMNRSFPAFVVPYQIDAPTMKEAVYCSTKDISDRGVSLVLPKPFFGDPVIVGLWPATERHPPEDITACFAIGNVRRNQPIGGGLWQLGVSLTEVLKCSRRLASLQPLADRLLPPALLMALPPVEPTPAATP